MRSYLALAALAVFAVSPALADMTHYKADLTGAAETPPNDSNGTGKVDATYDSVLARFSKRIDAGQVIIKRQRSADAAQAFGDHELDWVYIDGDHRYQGVKADLENFARAVKPGGFIAGDDYGQQGWWGDGVTQAVDEFAALDRCESLLIRGSQFLIKLS